MTQGSAAQDEHSEALTGLRALLAAFVFFFHAGADGAFPLAYGWSGVTGFFALSGYLFARRYFGRIDLSKTSISNYFVNRGARILPAYVFVVLLCVLLGRTTSLFDVPAHLTFVHTLFASTRMSLSSPMWSLGVEIPFYILCPWLLVLLHRQHNRWGQALILVALSLAGRELARALADLGYATSGSYDHQLFPTTILGRFSDFAAGIFLALLFAPKSPALARAFVAILGLATISVVLFSFHAHGGTDAAARFSSFSWLTLLLGIGYAAVLPWCETSKIARALLGNRFLVFLGEISYGTYLLQEICLDELRLVPRFQSLLGMSESLSGTIARLLAFAVVNALAAVLYFAMERPLGAWIRKRFRKPQHEPKPQDAGRAPREVSATSSSS